MNVVAFGSSGNVGQKVVKLLLSEGHDVTAFVHEKYTFPPHSKLHLVKGDIHDHKSVKNALQNNDAVISALGSWSTSSKDILSSGMATIIPAMEKLGVKRIVTVTGAGATFHNDKYFSLLSKFSRSLLQIFAKPILSDGEKHIEFLRNSDLAWTVLRSPVMKESTRDPTYKLTTDNPLPWETVNRNSVAKSMVDQLKDDSWLQQAPFIRNA